MAPEATVAAQGGPLSAAPPLELLVAPPLVPLLLVLPPLVLPPLELPPLELLVVPSLVPLLLALPLVPLLLVPALLLLEDVTPELVPPLLVPPEAPDALYIVPPWPPLPDEDPNPAFWLLDPHAETSATTHTARSAERSVAFETNILPSSVGEAPSKLESVDLGHRRPSQRRAAQQSTAAWLRASAADQSSVTRAERAVIRSAGAATLPKQRARLGGRGGPNCSTCAHNSS
jgi:hypothetical protein